MSLVDLQQFIALIMLGMTVIGVAAAVATILFIVLVSYTLFEGG